MLGNKRSETDSQTPTSENRLKFSPEVHVTAYEVELGECIMSATAKELVEEATTLLAMDQNGIGESKYSIRASALIQLANFKVMTGEAQ